MHMIELNLQTEAGTPHDQQYWEYQVDNAVFFLIVTHKYLNKPNEIHKEF